MANDREGREMTPQDDVGVVSAASNAEGIMIVRLFEAPPEEVYRAFVEREGMAAWFGEEGSSIPLETFEMDARAGGRYSLIMLHGPEQVQLPFAGRFLELIDPSRVVFTLEAEGNEEVLTAEIEDVGRGLTQLTFSQRGGNLSSNEYSRAMRGELIFLDRLATYLKTRHDTGA
jgi:uncharacterized protein YndB with AHSA1/START domain